MMKKILVAFFSASGITAEKAKQLAAAANAEVYEIRPAKPYTPADIKWTNPLARCNREWLRKQKPALADTDAPVAQYDVIFLAFPIWYYTAPLIVNSFVESYDLAGKTIVYFATSGGSVMNKVEKSLAPSAPGAVLREGKMLNGPLNEDELCAFAVQFSAGEEA